jgi:hypothetical protein
MLEQICYRQFNSLRKLNTERPAPESKIVPRQYYNCDEGMRSKLLEDWGIFTRSAPYLLSLYDNDLHPDVTSCVLHIVAVQERF